MINGWGIYDLFDIYGFAPDELIIPEIEKVLKSKDASPDYKKAILKMYFKKCTEEANLECDITKKTETLAALDLNTRARFIYYMEIAAQIFGDDIIPDLREYGYHEPWEKAPDKTAPGKPHRGAPPKEGNVVDYILPQYADSAEQIFNELKDFAQSRDFTKGKAAQARRAIIQKAMEHFDRVPTKILLLDLFGEENPSDSEIKAWDRYIRESDWPFLSDIELREKNRNRKQN